ncbi:MAG: hypothetical protein AAFX55_11785, partial [Bacteroidota bacterium]
MLSEDEKEFVNVKIVDVQTNLTPTEILLHVEIQNNFREPIWIVNDDWFVWKKEEENIHISLAREKMRPGVEVFGYFNPNRKKVGPQETFYRKLKLIFPLRLNMIWNKEDKVHLSPGKYQFKISCSIFSLLISSNFSSKPYPTVALN